MGFWKSTLISSITALYLFLGSLFRGLYLCLPYIPCGASVYLLPSSRLSSWNAGPRPGSAALALRSPAFSIALGILLNTSFNLHTNAFVTPMPQLISAVVAIVVLVIIALKLKSTSSRFKPSNTYPAPNARLVGIFSFAAESIFMPITSSLSLVDTDNPLPCLGCGSDLPCNILVKTIRVER